MTQNDLEHLGTSNAIYMLLVSLSPKCHAISLHDQIYLSSRSLCDKCTEWLHNTMNTIKSN